MIGMPESSNKAACLPRYCFSDLKNTHIHTQAMATVQYSSQIRSTDRQPMRSLCYVIYSPVEDREIVYQGKTWPWNDRGCAGGGGAP